MREHIDYEELVSAALDGELTADEHEELRAHLQSCRRCREYYAAMISVTEVMDTDFAVPPPELKQKIMARIAAEPTPVTELPRKTKSDGQTRWVRYASLAACVLLLAGVGMVTARGGRAKSAAKAESMMTAAASTTEAVCEEEAAPAEEIAEAPMLMMAAPAAAPATGDSIVNGDVKAAPIPAPTGKPYAAEPERNDGAVANEWNPAVSAAQAYLEEERAELCERVLDMDTPATSTADVSAAYTPIAGYTPQGAGTAVIFQTESGAIIVLVDETFTVYGVIE